MFFCKFCKISKSTISYRTPPVATSDIYIFIFIYVYIYIYIYIYVYIYTYIYMVFITEGFFEVAIESWPDTTIEFRSDALTDWAIRPWVQLALRANFVQLLQFHRLFSVTFHFGYCLRQSPRLFSSNFCWGNHMSVAEWVDTYGIHHWRILWSSYRKLAWVGFEPTTTEFRSDALTDWAILSTTWASKLDDMVFINYLWSSWLILFSKLW